MSVYSTADNGMILLSQQQIEQCSEVQQQQTNPPQCAIGGIADHQRASERGHHQRRQHQVGNDFVFRFQFDNFRSNQPVLTVGSRPLGQAVIST